MTDGLCDTVLPADEFFGRERLTAAVKEEAARPLPEMADRVADRVAMHRGSAPQQDDLTMLVIEF